MWFLCVRVILTICPNRDFLYKCRIDSFRALIVILEVVVLHLDGRDGLSRLICRLISIVIVVGISAIIKMGCLPLGINGLVLEQLDTPLRGVYRIFAYIFLLFILWDGLEIWWTLYHHRTAECNLLVLPRCAVSPVHSQGSVSVSHGVVLQVGHGQAVV